MQCTANFARLKPKFAMRCKYFRPCGPKSVRWMAEKRRARRRKMCGKVNERVVRGGNLNFSFSNIAESVFQNSVSFFDFCLITYFCPKQILTTPHFAAE